MQREDKYEKYNEQLLQQRVFKCKLLLTPLLILFIGSLYIWKSVENRVSTLSIPSNTTWPMSSLKTLDINWNSAQRKVSVVLLNWKRNENLETIIRNLSSYEFIKEIVIWNNDALLKLNESRFDTSLHVKIHNSDYNVKFLGRYLGCALSTGDYCYFQDDDYLVPSLNSFYSNFLQFPDYLHVKLDKESFLKTKYQWKFIDEGIHLNAAHTWLGFGSLIKRDIVQKFLKLTLNMNMTQEQMAMADLYFPLFMNQQFFAFIEPGLKILNQNYAFSSEPDVDKLNQRHMFDALDLLISNLPQNTININQLDYYMTSCPNDKCIFFTNKFTPNEQIPYQHSSFEKFLEYASQLDPKNVKQDDLSFIHAVDGKMNTFWESNDNIKANDFIGLDLLTLVPSFDLFTIKIHFIFLDSWTNELFMNGNTAIEISKDGNDYLEIIPFMLCYPLSKNPINNQDMDLEKVTDRDLKYFQWTKDQKDSLLTLQKGLKTDKEKLSYCNFHIKVPMKLQIEMASFKYIRLRAIRNLPMPYKVFHLGYSVADYL